MYYYDEILLSHRQLSLLQVVRNKDVYFLQYSKWQSFSYFFSVFLCISPFCHSSVSSFYQDRWPDAWLEESSLKCSCFVSGTYLRSLPVLSIQTEIVALELLAFSLWVPYKEDDAPDSSVLSRFSVSVSVTSLPSSHHLISLPCDWLFSRPVAASRWGGGLFICLFQVEHL